MDLFGKAIAFFLERLYTELAWAYDAVSWLASAGRWRAWTEMTLRYVRGRRVLEVGCGPGHLLPLLAEQDHRVVGCDLSPAMLRLARRRPGPALCRARSQELPFAAGTFDTLLSTFPSGYILDPRTWAEFRRVLAPGGRVVVLAAVEPGRPLLRILLRLGRVRAGRRPALTNRWCFRREVVALGKDRLLFWIAEEADAADAG